MSQEPALAGLAPTAPDKSRSPTSASDDVQTPAVLSPTMTLTDLAATNDKSKHEHLGVPQTSTMNTMSSSGLGKAPVARTENVLSSLPAGKKNVLLLCFSLAMFIDAAGVSATFIMTAPISADLGVKAADQAWVLGTYSMVFAATLLFSGRLADLFPPHRLYLIGFVGVATFSLVISFLPEQYSFYILRAFSALFAVLTIPSSINMIIQMYPDPVVQAKKLALFSLSGALANTLALLLAGVFLIANWRWWFRSVAIVVAPFALLAWYILPKTSAVAEDIPGSEKWKRLDLGGVTILVACLVLFILGFTQAPIQGWSAPIFIAPFIVSLALMPTFLFWEHKMPRGYALLPHGIWSYPNIFPLIIQATAPFMWFAMAQLRIATFFQEAHHDSAIMAAVKLLPMGVAALFAGGATQAFPWLITKPRYVQPVASALAMAGSLLFAFSDGGFGTKYWSLMFLGEVIGTAGAMPIFVGMNVSIIQAFPLEFAGVGGSFANVLFLIGGVVGISIQAGLLATGDGTLEDWTGSKNSYFFSGAYVMFTGLVFCLMYRQHKAADGTDDEEKLADV